MLRRKLLINLGPLVTLLLISAVLAIWLLQGVLERFDRVTRYAWQSSSNVTELTALSNRIEGDLYEVLVGGSRQADRLADAVEATARLAALAQRDDLCCVAGSHPLCQRVRQAVPRFQEQIALITQTRDPLQLKERVDLGLVQVRMLKHDVAQLSDTVRNLHRGEEAAVVSSFRRIVVGLAIVFLVVINLSVIILLRLGQMILRPIDKLIEATRALTDGRYDYRVKLEQRDEFGELAGAINGLAERLQADERRQLETLWQVALAMNHEINNAISIIELQLRLLSRQSGDGAAPQRYLQEIHQSLQRMTHTVQALKSVRRIVLTDYIPGIKMLDLERSQQTADEENTSLVAGA